MFDRIKKWFKVDLSQAKDYEPVDDTLNPPDHVHNWIYNSTFSKHWRCNICMQER